ncbi:hypothetical protein DPEC_G00040960 [Dallia pectoralis]|uniref:Uncharacterized protein n=1 Tax=Dallia pectoralis TaxID=75939 RepID=A0ACC2HF49_DALPE|nr:hypothetical protein DPEC_G00040960 [Dallia pectoralis]
MELGSVFCLAGIQTHELKPSLPPDSRSHNSHSLTGSLLGVCQSQKYSPEPARLHHSIFSNQQPPLNLQLSHLPKGVAKIFILVQPPLMATAHNPPHPAGLYCGSTVEHSVRKDDREDVSPMQLDVALVLWKAPWKIKPSEFPAEVPGV